MKNYYEFTPKKPSIELINSGGFRRFEFERIQVFSDPRKAPNLKLRIKLMSRSGVYADFNSVLGPQENEQACLSLNNSIKGSSSSPRVMFEKVLVVIEKLINSSDATVKVVINC